MTLGSFFWNIKYSKWLLIWQRFWNAINFRSLYPILIKSHWFYNMKLFCCCFCCCCFYLRYTLCQNCFSFKGWNREYLILSLKVGEMNQVHIMSYAICQTERPDQHFFLNQSDEYLHCHFITLEDFTCVRTMKALIGLRMRRLIRAFSVRICHIYRFSVCQLKFISIF